MDGTDLEDEETQPVEPESSDNSASEEDRRQKKSTVLKAEIFGVFGCTSLKAAAMGSGVKVIEENAFCKCRNLTGIKIPKSVTEIGMKAFYS